MADFCFEELVKMYKICRMTKTFMTKVSSLDFLVFWFLIQKRKVELSINNTFKKLV